MSQFENASVLADAVLALLKLKVAQEYPDGEGMPITVSNAGYDMPQKIHVSPYHNGCEHGWIVELGKNTVVFANQRNSDNLIVYRGLTQDFLPNGIPQEWTYNAGKEYRVGPELWAAVGYIAWRLFEQD